MASATVEDVLPLLQRTAQEVLDGKRKSIRLVKIGSWPRRIPTAEGLRRVDQKLRQAALEALQAELGMDGRPVITKSISGAEGLRYGMFQMDGDYEAWSTKIPRVFLVHLTWWGPVDNQAVEETWYLERINTTFFSRLQRRLFG